MLQVVILFHIVRRGVRVAATLDLRFAQEQPTIGSRVIGAFGL